MTMCVPRNREAGLPSVCLQPCGVYMPTSRKSRRGRSIRLTRISINWFIFFLESYKTAELMGLWRALEAIRRESCGQRDALQRPYLERPVRRVWWENTRALMKIQPCPFHPPNGTNARELIKRVIITFDLFTAAYRSYWNKRPTWHCVNQIYEVVIGWDVNNKDCMYIWLTNRWQQNVGGLNLQPRSVVRF